MVLWVKTFSLRTNIFFRVSFQRLFCFSSKTFFLLAPGFYYYFYYSILWWWQTRPSEIGKLFFNFYNVFFCRETRESIAEKRERERVMSKPAKNEKTWKPFQFFFVCYKKNLIRKTFRTFYWKTTHTHTQIQMSITLQLKPKLKYLTLSLLSFE